MLDVVSHGEVHVIRLDDGKVNALGRELLEALVTTLEGLATDDAVGALVIAGNDRAFSAGVDLVRIIEGGVDYTERFLQVLTTAFETVFRFPRPVVAAVTGHALAGGCVLASACDHVVASTTATVGLTEFAVGVPFPTSAIEIMRFRVGPRELPGVVLAARGYDAATALEVGLVDEVVDPREVTPRALAVAERLAVVPAPTFQLTKDQLRRGALERLAAHTADWDPEVVEIWCGEDARTAIADFVDRRLRR